MGEEEESFGIVGYFSFSQSRLSKREGIHSMDMKQVAKITPQDLRLSERFL